MEKQTLLVEALQKENIICRENEPLAGHTGCSASRQAPSS